jgi:hypothetical protein
MPNGLEALGLEDVEDGSGGGVERETVRARGMDDDAVSSPRKLLTPESGKRDSGGSGASQK